MTYNEKAHEIVHVLEYNAERPHLMIPEYGRHLQKLIDQATIIEDREERNKAARYIIKVMGSLNPHLRDVLDFQHKLWDQLFIMSDFKLDVDSPYPIPTREVINLKPERLDYPQKNPKYRFYGNNIKYMIANHMKKSYLSWNKDTVDDKAIFDHLLELSGGKIDLHQSSEELLNTSDLMRTNKKVSNKNMPLIQKNLLIKKNNKNTKAKPYKNNNQK